jgi:hypothetical protein
MERRSRLEWARQKLRLTRYVVIAGSTAAFGGFALMARASHSGKSTASSQAATSAQSSSSAYSDDSSGDDSQSQSFDYGNSSLSPSAGSGPLVQSSGS